MGCPATGRPGGAFRLTNGAPRRLAHAYRYGMDYTHLGRSGVSVSRLCLGTMNFGAFTDAADAHRIMDRAVQHGINFFDEIFPGPGGAAPEAYAW